MSDAKLMELFDEYWEHNLEVSPSYATFVGRHDSNHKLEDISREAYEVNVAWIKQFLSRLKDVEAKTLQEENQLSRQILIDQIELSLEFDHYDSHCLAIDQMLGIHLGFLQIARVHPIENVKDVQDYVSRLKAHKDQLEHTLSYLKEGLEKGWTVPKRTIELVISQLEGMALCDPRETRHFLGVQEKSENLGDQAKSALDEVAEAVRDHVQVALKELLNYLKGEYLQRTRSEVGLCALKGGADYYALCIQKHTGLKQDAREIHELGLNEVDRIHKEMEEVQESLGIEGSLRDFFTAMRDDRARHYDTREEIVLHHRSLLEKMNEKLKDFFHHLPENAYEVHPMGEYQEREAPDAFYMPGDSHNKRPGIYFVNTYAPETRGRFNAEVLAYHEAVPGHHLQISIAQELEHLPEFRKRSQETAYVEGWALYTEKLAGEMGFYQDKASVFGRLSFELWRAGRLVVDTGMHALGWSRERAIRFMSENTGLSKPNIEVEIDRYIVYPGQALSYKIGEIFLLKLRREMKEKLGENFNIKDFHHSVLRHGAIELPLLGKLVREDLLNA